MENMVQVPVRAWATVGGRSDMVRLPWGEREGWWEG